MSRNRRSSRMPTSAESSARIVRSFRLGTGSLTVDGSGLVAAGSGLGGFSSSSSGAFFFTPLNMGALADIALHFEYWSLKWFTVHYEPLFRPVSTSASAIVPGTVMIAYGDDPDRCPTSAPSSGQIVDSRNVIERALDRAWSWTVRPRHQVKLSTSLGTSITGSALDLRFARAGFLTFAATQASTFVSGSIGRIYVTYECSLSGSNAMNQVLTSSVGESRSEAESKTETKVAALARTRAEADSGFELVELSSRSSSGMARVSPAAAGGHNGQLAKLSVRLAAAGGGKLKED